jgi:ABC-type Na+ efflux pump permease subunit
MDPATIRIFALSLLVILPLLYFLPSILGRKKSNAKAIFWLNFLAGWTFVGWIVALVWALTVEAKGVVAQ